VTENAVRTQLHELERLGLVTRISRRKSTSKPAVVFGITSEGQVAFSAAYAPVLRDLVSSAVELFPSPKVDELMRKCGERIAADFGEPPTRLPDRIRGAAGILNALGGDAVVQRRNGYFALESRGCPLSAVTVSNPAACRIMESIVHRYVRAPVETCCSIAENPRCCFLITPGPTAKQLA
jgi:predicted ArsR family transcriptional regulator